MEDGWKVSDDLGCLKQSIQVCLIISTEIFRVQKVHRFSKFIIKAFTVFYCQS